MESMGSLILEDSWSALHMSDFGGFARRVLSMSFADFRPPPDALRAFRLGTVEFNTMVLCREGQFQIEYILCSPTPGVGSVVPEHCHPNVHSIDMFVHGQLGPLSGVVDCTYGGKRRVGAGVYHGATVGESGSAILCIQQWLNGIEPTSIALDWRGTVHPELRSVRIG
jgi:hypothetical protein